MTFLPIVERELRTAARRRSTYRTRVWTAVIAIIVGWCALVPVSLGAGRGGLGNGLFTVLTGYAFGLCLLAGIFLTADCLSVEKREGTLGLLFLTDLKGYDVVLGKFFGTSLNALYALLALLPVSALPVLLGGITGGEFWRMSLALINGLFLSLATGICVSAFARDAQTAMGNTLGLLLLWTAVLPLFARIRWIPGFSAAAAACAWLGPWYPFVNSRDLVYVSQPAKYWGPLFVSHGVAWLLLALASAALPHNWQERGKGATSLALSGPWRGTPVTQANRASLRQQLLSISPVLWLIGPEPGMGRLAWVIVVLWGAAELAVITFMPTEAGPFLMSGSGMRLFGFLVKALIAVQACRFFTQARRSGSLELLLCTPLTNRDLIRGQMLALKRTFLVPTLVFLSLLYIPLLVQMAGALPSLNFQGVFAGAFGVIFTAIFSVRFVADIFAVCYVGMWLALSSKNPNHAPAMTILYVLVLPSFLCWLDLLADLVFISWASAKLQQDFRKFLARQYTPTGLLPPIITPPTRPARPNAVSESPERSAHAVSTLDRPKH